MTGAPKTTVLLPFAYLLHLAEEWFGDLPAWTVIALGNEVPVERFLLINAIAIPIIVAGTVAALRIPRFAWIATSMAALFGVNGILHALATLGIGLYSPGILSGLLVYVPVCAHILWTSSSRLPTPVFAGAVVLGVLLHVVVSILAFF